MLQQLGMLIIEALSSIIAFIRCYGVERKCYQPAYYAFKASISQKRFNSPNIQHCSRLKALKGSEWAIAHFLMTSIVTLVAFCWRCKPNFVER